MTALLKIEDLRVAIDGNEIVKGLSLEIGFGEKHAIMGPNGSGKSTLSKVLAGHPDYEVLDGSVQFAGVNLLELDTADRSLAGLFLGFQYPPEVPGVNNADFLRQALNIRRKAQKLEELDPLDFNDLLEKKLAELDLHNDIYQERSVNDGFSGGEKKRNEILQMAILEPKLVILDEIDSGLDIDALRLVSKGVNAFASNPDRSLLLITHYQRLLEYIIPTHVHVMIEGKIVKSGGKELAEDLEINGYEQFAGVL